MTELSPKARALLSRTASDFEPTQADRERLRSSLRARMLAGAATAAAVPAALKAAASTAPPAAAAGPTSVLAATSAGTVVSKLLLVKIGIALLVVGAAATTTAVVASRGDVEPVNAPGLVAQVSTIVPTSAPSPAAPLDVPSSPTVEPAPTPEVVASATNPPVRIVTASPVATSKPSSPAADAPPAAVPASRNEEAFDAEMALMREVQVALRSHDGARALAALDAHDARFGDGALAEERAAARVIALCELGRATEASSARSSFFSSYPRSPQAERVRRACTPNE